MSRKLVIIYDNEETLRDVLQLVEGEEPSEDIALIPYNETHLGNFFELIKKMER